MKAIICTGYGAPEVLKLQKVDIPTPKDNEIQIKVHASVVGPSDCAFRKGDPFIVKIMYGLSKPKLAIQGVEFSGRVSAIGKNVTQFKVGDAVFGTSPDTFGAHGEYFCLPEDKPIVIKPETISDQDAVAILDGALTSLIFLRDQAKLHSGQRILINGASGAVGAYAVQLAKYYGAHVTGVCSTANVALIKSLGADKVIDYTKTDLAKTGQTYNVIYDAVGKSSFSQCKDSLTPNGIYLTTVPTLGIVFEMLWTSKFSSKKAVFTAAGLQQTKDNLNTIAALYTSGKLKAVIDRSYPLEQIPDAHRYVDTGRKKGNVIITVA